MDFIEPNKAKFTEIFTKYIKREGSENLLEWLNKSDFFTAPASQKFHSAMLGGLCLHSINVFERMIKLCKSEYGDKFEEKFSMETLAICGLLHDVCKVEFYKQDMRNVKVDGVWTQVPFFSIEEKLPYGHGEKSAYIINGFLRLTREEAMAINWHMGGFDTRVKGGSFSLSDAFNQYPLVIHMNVADMQAAYIDEAYV